MHGPTHSLSGIVAAEIVAPLVSTTPLEKMMFVGIAGTAALLPDLDIYLPIKHRGISHTVWPGVAIALLAMMALHQFGVGTIVGISLLTGWIMHLVGDSLTVHGVAPLAPFSKWRIRGKIKTQGRKQPPIVYALLRGKGIKLHQLFQWAGEWDKREALIAIVLLVLSGFLLYEM